MPMEKIRFSNCFLDFTDEKPTGRERESKSKPPSTRLQSIFSAPRRDSRAKKKCGKYVCVCVYLGCVHIACSGRLFRCITPSKKRSVPRVFGPPISSLSLSFSLRVTKKNSMALYERH